MITTIIIAIIGWGIAIFLGKEMRKKFRFHYLFCMINVRQVAFHRYMGSEKREMRNIVLRASGPFSALIGFQFGKDGIDFYGFCKSDQNGIMVISTYLGKGPCQFIFLCDVDTHIYNMRTSSTEEDQKLTPQATFPPHWWQRFV